LFAIVAFKTLTFHKVM